MAIVAVDFETYWANNYSLSRMPEVDYLLDPRFQVIMVTLKVGDNPTEVYTELPRIREALAAIDWDNNSLLSHNIRFDGAILAWHFGHVPRLYLDTLSMARAMTHPFLGSSKLEAVATGLGLPPKGDEVLRAIGKRREDFTDAELAAYAEYCARDTELCRMIFDRFLAAGFPHSELRVIDLATRMFIDPQVRLDAHKLAEYHNLVLAEKHASLQRIEYMDKSVFASNEKFAQLLETQGVAVPTKISPTTGQLTWALARGDREFKELCADPEQPPYVQALLAMRQGVKSTIEETRTATMLNLSQRDWGTRGSGWMPVPYTYYGAHTGRFSGTGGYNFANLKRGSPIRDAIVAPEGWRIVHRDASQIECRLLAWLAGCTKLTTAFAEGRDVYSEFATRFYGQIVTKEDVPRRFTGKTAVLSLGYAAGAARFRHALFIGQGGVSVELTEAEAQNLVAFYRREYREIPALWELAEHALLRMIQTFGRHTGRREFDPDTRLPIVEEAIEALYLPNGMALQYPDIWLDPTTDEISYKDPYAGRKKIYGGKLVENVTQALARIIVTDIMRRVHHATGIRPFMGTYDSWDYVIPASEAPMFDELLAAEFCIGPLWTIGLPLASEGGWGRTLLEAERRENR
jgi:hypothetical protein